MPAPAVALVGLGRWGRNYLRTIQETGIVRLVAICDPNPQVLEVPGVPLYRTMDGMLAAARFDAAVIATPASTHAALARQCLQAGLDVLVEKPMALSSAEARKLVRLADRLGQVLATGFPTMYLPGCAAARAMVADGQLDPVCSVEALRTSKGTPDPCADVLWDLAPHDLALAINLLGQPTSFDLERDGSRAEYSVEFLHGASLHGKVEWRPGPAERWFRLAGRHGTLEVKEEPVKVPGDRPLARLLADFAAGCASRSEPLSSGRLGLEVVGCLEALEASGMQTPAMAPAKAPAC
jgi:predicted dehydrogenase